MYRATTKRIRVSGGKRGKNVFLQ